MRDMHTHVGHGVIDFIDVKDDELELLRNMCSLLYPFSLHYLKRTFGVLGMATIDGIVEQLANPRFLLDGPSLVFRHAERRRELEQIVSLWIQCMIQQERIAQRVSWENSFYKHTVDIHKTMR